MFAALFLSLVLSGGCEGGICRPRAIVRPVAKVVVRPVAKVAERKPVRRLLSVRIFRR